MRSNSLEDAHQLWMGDTEHGDVQGVHPVGTTLNAGSPWFRSGSLGLAFAPSLARPLAQLGARPPLASRLHSMSPDALPGRSRFLNHECIGSGACMPAR